MKVKVISTYLGGCLLDLKVFDLTTGQHIERVKRIEYTVDQDSGKQVAKIFVKKIPLQATEVVSYTMDAVIVEE